MFLISLFLLVATACTPNLSADLQQKIHPFECSYQQNANPLTQPRRYIAHAGGSIDGHKYTNSLEAVKKSIKKGRKLIELDLIETADGHLVAAHDWKHWRSITGFSEKKIPSKKEFMAMKIHGKYTPLEAKSIAKLFKSHPDLILVSDKTKNFKKLMEVFDFPERLIVEVFSIDDYKKALATGIRYPALSLEAAGRRRAVRFAKKYQIPLVVLSTQTVPHWQQELSELVAQGTCIYAFTSNDPEFHQRHFNRHLFGVYID